MSAAGREVLQAVGTSLAIALIFGGAAVIAPSLATSVRRWGSQT